MHQVLQPGDVLRAAYVNDQSGLFPSTVEPTTPFPGMIWLDTSNDDNGNPRYELRVYDGGTASWVHVGRFVRGGLRFADNQTLSFGNLSGTGGTFTYNSSGTQFRVRTTTGVDMNIRTGIDQDTTVSGFTTGYLSGTEYTMIQANFTKKAAQLKGTIGDESTDFGLGVQAITVTATNTWTAYLWTRSFSSGTPKAWTSYGTTRNVTTTGFEIQANVSGSANVFAVGVL